MKDAWDLLAFLACLGFFCVVGVIGSIFIYFCYWIFTIIIK